MTSGASIPLTTKTSLEATLGTGSSSNTFTSGTQPINQSGVNSQSGQTSSHTPTASSYDNTQQQSSSSTDINTSGISTIGLDSGLAALRIKGKGMSKFYLFFLFVFSFITLF